MKTTREVLVAARALIAEPGAWRRQFDPFASDGRFTAIEALSRAAGSEVCNNAVYLDACRRLRCVIGSDDEEYGLTKWNRRASRKHTEVLAAFDKAIAGCL